MKKLPMSISGAFFISNRCNGKPLPQKRSTPSALHTDGVPLYDVRKRK